MENYEVNPQDGGFGVDGLPDHSERIVAIDGPKAERLAHLSLHIHDLRFVLECVATLETQKEQLTHVVRMALWQSAVVSFCRCFDASGKRRTQLPVDKIYEAGLQRNVVQYIRDLATSTSLTTKILTHRPCREQFLRTAPSITTSRRLFA